MSDKTHAVLDRLPQHRHALCELMLADPSFRSLCENYGEVLEALRHWERSTDRHRQTRVEEFGALLAELESEVLAELGVR